MTAEAQRYDFRAMGSPCALHLHAPDPGRSDAVASLALGEVSRLEKTYSRYLDDSVASQINASAGRGSIRVDDETAALLDYAQTAFQQSQGLFDITSGVLRRVWDFKSGRVPTQPQIDAARARVGWRRLSWKRPELTLPDGMELDFGGFVKEYAADRTAELCRRNGVRHGLVDLGGDLSVIGPHPDGEPWRIGIRDPRNTESALMSLTLWRGGMATSGDYERFMIVDGVRYGHILDPRSGRPVVGLRSVSVAADHCLVAGTSSTIAMLMGRRGERWLDELGLPNLRVDELGRLGGSLADPPPAIGAGCWAS